jgi:hypothetical protein
VTFTGSEGGGMALFRRAQVRPDPIPVFCEMTSVNPNFVLPAALAARGAEISDGLAERMLVNIGQACLKPAILLAVDGPGPTASWSMPSPHPQEVGYATIHGGPFPATTDRHFTSVGMTAIRFLRPVTYQGFPDALLPDALAEANPEELWRLIDGQLTSPE